MYNNWYTHYSRKSVFVQKKNYQRSHNVCFQNRQGAFHWTSLYPGELPRTPVKNFNTHTQKKIWREKKTYLHTRGSNIFLKVTLWSSKIWTVIFFFVASCLFSERWAWWGSVCAGRGAGSGGHRGEHENCGPNESKRMCRGHRSEEPGFLKPDLFWSGQQWRWIEGWLFNEFSQVYKSLWEAYNSACLLEEIHPEHLCSC